MSRIYTFDTYARCILGDFFQRHVTPSEEDGMNSISGWIRSGGRTGNLFAPMSGEETHQSADRANDLASGARNL